MVEMLALQLDYFFFILDLFSANRANLDCFVVFALFVAVSLSDRAKVLFAPA